MYGNTCHQHSKVPKEELAIGFSWRWRGLEVEKLRSPYTQQMNSEKLNANVGLNVILYHMYCLHLP